MTDKTKHSKRPRCVKSTDEESNQAMDLKIAADIHVTGFGKFHGVLDNPTKRIVDAINSDPSSFFNAQCTSALQFKSAHVLDVSASTVIAYFQQLRETHIKSLAPLTKPVILLHFGVAASAHRYDLEQRAVNLAHFRAPDEHGFQPQNEPICPTLVQHGIIDPLLHDTNTSNWYYSNLPVPVLADLVNQSLANSHSSLPVVLQPTEHVILPSATKDPLGDTAAERQVIQEEEEDGCDANFVDQFCFPSNDPGRFLCNFIYCTSLRFAQSMNTKNSKYKVHSLFIHVPSHQTVPIEEQTKFVRAVLNSLSSIVLQMYNK